MTDPRPVLLTGAAGRIGTALRERLPPLGWQLRCFDKVAIPATGPDTTGPNTSASGVESSIVGDIASPADLDAAMAGVQAVVHLAGVPTEAPWPAIRDANVDGLVTVFEAARRHGVRRVVWASSNHAVGFTPTAPDLPADLPPRPDTLYGVSKAFGEALGRYYVDRYAMQVACLRIGTFTDRPDDMRTLSTWLSPADCTRLVDACLRAPDLGFAIVWGVSANARRVWSLDAGRALGFEPRDDAESCAGSLRRPDPDPSDAFVGGGFTSPGFGIDEVLERS